MVDHLFDKIIKYFLGNQGLLNHLLDMDRPYVLMLFLGYIVLLPRTRTDFVMFVLDYGALRDSSFFICSLNVL